MLLFKPVNSMKTVFSKSLKSVIIISKCFGFINFCFTMETGLLRLQIKSTYYLLMEILRFFVFLISSYYTIFIMEKHFIILRINAVQFWIIIIAARNTEKSTIKYVIDSCYKFYYLLYMYIYYKY